MPNTINVYTGAGPTLDIFTGSGAVSVKPEPIDIDIFSPAGPPGPPGPPGAGLLIKGTVPSKTNLPTTGNVYGDLWIAQDTGHGWLWELPGIWGDVGQIQGAVGPAGPQGVTGAQGPTGPVGATGGNGPQGLPGAAGSTGPQGPIGNTGPAGPSGPQGAQGPSGSIGNQGLQGPKGDTGAIGPAGATGPQGSAGPQGPKGDPGATGAAGATGSQGPAGPQGPTGLTGSSGPAGSPGATGATGAQGLTGPQGLTGATGAAGPQGLAGQNGATGATGSAGATGAQGPAGPTGATGAQGPAGASITGPQGPPGNQGPQGPAGSVGPSGAPGPTGPQGQGYQWRGSWVSVIAYTPYDTVSRNGGSYVAIAPSTGVDPATDNGTSWQIVATPGGAGAPGPIGPQGPTGATGSQGSTGPTGPTGPQGPSGPQGPPGPPGSVHHVRVRAANNALNAAVPNGGALQFDTVDYDADGFAPTTTPFNRITVPAGFDGVYLIVCDSSTTGNQGSTIGMGIGINGVGVLSPSNQYITGPASVTYALTSAPSQIAHLKGGDYVQLVNNSTSGANDPFTSVFLALARLDVGGPIGPQGPKGDPGATGPAGAAGPKGDTGSQGPTGGTGPQGTAGSPGPQGIQGPTGLTGDTGPAGATGPQGSTGPQGIPGPTGPAGSQGPAGATGPQGPAGLAINWRGIWSGSTAYAVNDAVSRTNQSYICTVTNTGNDPATDTTHWNLMAAQGATGPQGPTGNTGPQGPQGSTGNTGATGPQGPAGPSTPSTNTGNLLTTGSDSLLYLPPSALDPEIWSQTRRVFNSVGNCTFECDQRNVATPLTNPANGTFIQDRYQISSAGITGTVNTALQTGLVLLPGTNFAISNNFQRFTVGTAQASMAAGNYYGFQQYVEGPQWRELSSDVHSVSLLVRSSVAGLAFALALANPGRTSSLCRLCTISSANTWMLIQLPNIPVWSGSGFVATPGSQAYFLGIYLASGTTFIPAANNAWSPSDFRGAIGMSNFLATAGATFDIAFIQHEAGALCTTPIDYPFAKNLDGCLRYFTKSFPYSNAPGSITAAGRIVFPITTGFPSNMLGATTFIKPLAKVPTFNIYSDVTGAINNVRKQTATAGDVATNGASGSDKALNQVNLQVGANVGDLITFHYTADTGF